MNSFIAPATIPGPVSSVRSLPTLAVRVRHRSGVAWRTVRHAHHAYAAINHHRDGHRWAATVVRDGRRRSDLLMAGSPETSRLGLVSAYFHDFLVYLPVVVAVYFCSLQAYEDFVLNAYAWIMVGILFRLPRLALSPQFAAALPQIAPPLTAQRAAHWTR